MLAKYSDQDPPPPPIKYERGAFALPITYQLRCTPRGGGGTPPEYGWGVQLWIWDPYP